MISRMRRLLHLRCTGIEGGILDPQKEVGADCSTSM
mgnify:CR=1 FL=1